MKTVWIKEFYDPVKAAKVTPDSLVGTRKKVYERIKAGDVTSIQVAKALGMSSQGVRKHLYALTNAKLLTKRQSPDAISNIQHFRIAA